MELTSRKTAVVVNPCHDSSALSLNELGNATRFKFQMLNNQHRQFSNFEINTAARYFWRTDHCIM